MDLAPSEVSDKDATSIDALVDAALASVQDTEIAASMQKYRIAPRREMRLWEYGLPDEAYPCWIVLENRELNTAIAYCQPGSVPFDPWGLLALTGERLGMGDDTACYPSLEEAFRASWMSEP